jgi:peptidoglycan hydrolase CwlO-like protein
MSILRRILGVLLIAAAIGGLIFSLAGIVILRRIEPDITKGLQDVISLVGQTLETTSQGLVVTQQSIESSVASIQALQDTVSTTAKTIQSASPMVSQLQKIMHDDLPKTIEATQASLDTAAQSAKVVDGVLSTLSKVPLLGSSIGYNPAVPLNVALSQVSASLVDLPNTFNSMESSLKDTGDNLQTFQADLETMGASIGKIQSSVTKYEQVIGDYQKSLDQVQGRLDTLSKSLPNLVHTLMLALIFFLIWMAVAQIGLFIQGWELVSRKDAPIK